MGFLYGQELTPPLETVRAYQDAIAEPFGLEDWLALEPLIEASLASASAQQLCAYVRLSGWDEACFMRCMPHLLARVQSGSVSAQVGLGVVRMVDQVWLGHLPEIDPEPDERQDVAPDLAFVMALLLFGLERYERAIALFESSLALRGSSAAVLYNMALCAAQLGQSQRALEHVDAALALDSNFPGASEMRLRLMSRL
jgi:tetratricopeptide (TPR) repeat protein